MKKGIEQGTSQLLKQLKNCTIYGKTGTAQVCSKKKSQEHQEDETLKNHGWFVGYIVPNNQKPLAIMVFLEHVGSARTAVATAYKFLQRWLFC
jgi:cell division protein FtsI/penicillin-binding protein 2